MNKPMRDRAEFLENYWRTYVDQAGFEEYSEETFLADALYGIGVAISEEYKCAGGYDRFKDVLRDFLDAHP